MGDGCGRCGVCGVGCGRCGFGVCVRMCVGMGWGVGVCGGAWEMGVCGLGGVVCVCVGKWCVWVWVCVGVRVCGCVGVWVCGCVGVWVCGQELLPPPVLGYQNINP